MTFSLSFPSVQCSSSSDLLVSSSILLMMNLLCVRNWGAHKVPFPKTQPPLSGSSHHDYGRFDQTVELIWKNGRVSMQVLTPISTLRSGRKAMMMMPDLDMNYEKQTDNVNVQDDIPVGGHVWEEPLHEAVAPKPAAAAFFSTGKHHPAGGARDHEKKPASEPDLETETVGISLPTAAFLNMDVDLVGLSDMESVMGQAISVSEVVGSCSVNNGPPAGRVRVLQNGYVSDNDERDTASSVFFIAPANSNSGNRNGIPVESGSGSNWIANPNKKLKLDGGSSIATSQSISPPSDRDRDRKRRNRMKRKMKRDVEASRLGELMEQMKQLDTKFHIHLMHANVNMASNMMMFNPMMMMNMGMAPVPALFNPNYLFMPQFPPSAANPWLQQAAAQFPPHGP